MVSMYRWSSLVAQMIKNLLEMQETQVRSLGGRFPGEENGYPLHYSCPENSMGRGAQWATVHGVAESDTIEQLILSLSWTNRFLTLSSCFISFLQFVSCQLPCSSDDKCSLSLLVHQAYASQVYSIHQLVRSVVFMFAAFCRLFITL